MRDEAEGKKAIQDLNNSQLGGKFISVSVARVREERNNANSNKRW
jgi:RNA recognition motif-containing protein